MERKEAGKMTDEEYVEQIVEDVTEIADAINKKRGYATTHKEAEVSIILEAYWLLLAEGEKIRCETALGHHLLLK